MDDGLICPETVCLTGPDEGEGDTGHVAGVGKAEEANKDIMDWWWGQDVCVRAGEILKINNRNIDDM